MGETVIKVENLSKKFIIGHQRSERYTALRDVMVNNVKGAFRKTRELIKGNAMVEGVAEEFWALKDVNFEVKQGDRIGIMGRNGACKSTLLKILSKITEPTTGRITLNGRVASLLEVGTGFHPELTGRENIFLNGAILGMGRSEIKKKFDEIVAFAEVEKFLDTPVKRYSSGMYVRLAFAVAAHLEPEILIVDEVLAVGDAQFQKKCLGKMEDVSKNEGRTILFVSHNMDAIINLCEKGMLFANGILAFKGDVKKCISEYQQAFGANRFNNNVWQRNNQVSTPHVLKASIELTGQQPLLELKVKFTVACAGFSRPALVAFDIQNSLGVTLMQALPKIEPFILFDGKEHEYETLINLEGVIPDNYYLSIWIGPHNTETYDWVQNIVSFEITKSPTEGRTFPHHQGHGFIVPNSSITLI